MQSARESAHRASCENNLRQIAVAFQSHIASLSVLPSGGWDWWTPPTYAGGRAASGARQGAGWAFQILPYLEGGSTRSGHAGNDQQLAIEAIGTAHAVYFCPTRRSPQTITYSDPFYLGGLQITHALCDYAGSNIEGTGAVRQYRPVALREITDGTSKTIIVGDKRLNLADLGRWQEVDNEGYTVGWDEDTMRSTDRGPAADHQGPGDGGQLFGSSHPGVANFALADGSVHTISFEIDPAVFQLLGNKSDGKLIPADSY